MIPAASALLAMRSKGAPIPGDALTSAGFGISVQCWSFKEFTLFQAIEMAAAAGMGGVEVYPGQKLGGGHGDLKFGPDLPDDKIQAVLEHLKKHNLVAYNFGVTAISKKEEEARKILSWRRR
jgi:sugar phosphate isomerase/epimerase